MHVQRPMVIVYEDGDDNDCEIIDKFESMMNLINILDITFG